MLAMRRILLPVDFSERSESAGRQAAALARHFQSKIVVLHAQPPLSYHYGAGALDGAYIGAPELLAEATERKRRELEGFLADELGDFAVRRVLMEGEPARRIVQFAAEEKTDVIVMPTRGHGPFRRFILGSVTAKVLHDVECPVWTGVHLEPLPASDSIPIRTVLCAVDLSDHSRKTLCWAAQMAAEFGAHLALVHATASMELSGAGGKYFTPEWRNALVAYASDEIARLQEAVGTAAEVFIESGDVPKTVRLAAEESHADLLVIGRSPSRGIAGRLRTNAYAIIRESPCPVVSV